MKKAIYILAIAVLMVSMISVTAFAHGGHGNGDRVQQPRYELCTVAGCGVLGPHQHNGIWYGSQPGYCGDYEVCPVEGCTQIGLHEHNGVYYRCVNYGMGRGCGRLWNR